MTICAFLGHDRVYDKDISVAITRVISSGITVKIAL